MKKMLKTEEPLADAFTNFSVLFSMFQTDEKYYPWLVNEFIQIYTLKDLCHQGIRGGSLAFYFNKYGDWQLFEYSANPFLDYEKISYHIFNRMLQYIPLVSVCVDALLADKYIFLPVDMYELPYYRVFHKERALHYVFISGFDSERQVFYLSDNFYDGRYQQVECPYTLLTKAYESLIIHPELTQWCSTGGVCFFRFAQKPWHKDKKQLYEVNIQTIKTGIHQYLLHEEYIRSYQHIDCYQYGISCYEELEGWIRLGMGNKDRFVDHRAFSAMLDHKKVMLFRLEYLQKMNSTDLSGIIKGFEWIKKMLELVIMKLIKGNLTKNTENFKDCLSLLGEIREKEISLLNQFLDLPI